LENILYKILFYKLIGEYMYVCLSITYVFFTFLYYNRKYVFNFDLMYTYDYNYT